MDGINFLIFIKDVDLLIVSVVVSSSCFGLRLEEWEDITKKIKNVYIGKVFAFFARDMP